MRDESKPNSRTLTAFRFTPLQRQLLERLAKKLAMTKTDVVGQALWELGQRIFPKG